MCCIDRNVESSENKKLRDVRNAFVSDKDIWMRGKTPKEHCNENDACDAR
jgi:hypothetical protein